MTGNIDYLSDFKEFDGGYVTFGGGAHGGRIFGKGTLKTDSLDFKDVYFVNELKFNLFSVSRCFPSKDGGITGNQNLLLDDQKAVEDGAENRLNVPEWLLSRAVNEPDERERRVFPMNAIRIFDRFNRYPRVAAWRKKKGRFTSEMVFGFFQGNIPVARLTSDDIEARSDWWISSKAYFDGFIDQVERVPFDLSRHNMYEISSGVYRQFVEQKIKLERNKKDVHDIKEEIQKFRQEMNARSVRQENTVPIIVGQHYGLSDFSEFRSMQRSTNWKSTLTILVNPENVRLTVLMKLQEAIDEEAILEEQILALMHRFADRFTDSRIEINNLMVLQDHPLIDYGKYAPRMAYCAGHEKMVNT
ncbi:hypothetical protein Tco_0606284 [Tanacetum coccineum]